MMTEGMGDVTNMTFNGVPGTEITELDFDSNATISMWYWLDAELPSSAGTYTLTATTTSLPNRVLGLQSFTGVAQRAPDNVATNSCTACSSISQSVTAVSDNSLIVDLGGTGDQRTFTGTNGITDNWDTNANSSAAAGGYKTVNAGSTTGGYNLNSSANRIGYIIAAFSPVSIDTKILYDNSGNNNHGTLTNNPTWAPGKFGSALSFDGTGDYIDVGNDPSLDLQTFTFTAWVKSASTTGGRTIIGSSADGGYQFRLESSTNKLQFNKQGNLNIFTTPDGYTVTNNVWTHVAMSYSESGEYAAYINGALVASGTNDQTLSNSSLLIGRGYSSGEYFNGLLDDVKVYNYIRTPTQIIEDMNGGHPIGGSPVGSQMVYWKFDEMQGQTANNSGFGSTTNNATLGANSSSSSDDPTWRTQADCKINGCLEFDGGDYTTANVSALTNFAISMWVKPDAVTSRGIAGMAESPGSGTHDRDLYFDSNSKFVGRIYDGGDKYARSTTTAVAGNWYHVVYMYDGSNLSLWINGIKEAETAAGNPYTGYSTPEYIIGRVYPGMGTGDPVITNQYFDGTIDEVKIYNTALTPEQILIDMNANAAVNAGAGTNEASELTDGLGNNPRGWWEFDENTGQALNDMSGNSFNGTLGSGSGSDTNDPIWVPGKVGSALKFDGTNDIVTLGTNSIGNNLNGASAITLSAWAKINRCPTAGGRGRIFSQLINGEAGGLSLTIYDTNCQIELLGRSRSADSVQIGLTSHPNTSGWHHYTVIWDIPNDRMELYFDGRLINTHSGLSWGNSTFTQGTASYNDSFGAKHQSTGYADFFNGEIDQVKLYKYRRTAAQIAYDYNRGRPVGHWKFDECTGSTLYDASGNSKNATISIGGTGTYTSTGSCDSGVSTEAWNGGTIGKFNGSLGFDGSDDYAYIDSPNLPTTDFTYSLWFYQTLDSSDALVYIGDGAGGNEFKIDRPANSEVRVRIDNATRCSGGPVPDINRWNHFAVTRSGGTVTGYLNGKVSCTGTEPDTLSFSSCPFIIGGDDASVSCDRSSISEYWQGKLDDIRVYNYALSEDQIQKVMKSDAALFFGPNTGSP